MKTLFILVLAVCMFLRDSVVFAQGKSKVYKVWIDQFDKGNIITGFLYYVNDSSLFVSYEYVKTSNVKNPPVFNTIAANNIGVIKLRRKGAVGKGAIIGTFAGMVLGGIVGFAQGDDEPSTSLLSVFADPAFTKEQKAGVGVFIGAQVGAILGSLLGTIKIKIPIHGDRNLYKSKLQKLNGYVYK